MIVFVELHPYASRLQVLGPAVRAADSIGPVVVILHRRPLDDHFSAWVESLPSRTQLRWLPRTPMVPKRIPASLVLKAFWLARRYAGEDGLIMFTALDDYFVSFALAAPLMRRVRGRLRVVIYRPDFLLRSGGSVRRNLKTVLYRVTQALRPFRTIVFDERLAERHDVIWWPDPWEGEFGHRDRVAARRRLSLDPDLPTVGLIGRQDRRKGFPLAAQTLSLLLSQGWRGQCLILGRVDQDYAEQLAHLRSLMGARLVQEVRFVSDDELPDYFAACDRILLPYHSSFTATSGVLARASASGVAVVASDGGLVGYRVRKHKLGTAVSPEALDEWARAIREPIATFEPRAAAGWAHSCHVESFMSQVRESLERGHV